jgi:DNA-binding transcriptional MerR regulator
MGLREIARDLRRIERTLQTIKKLLSLNLNMEVMDMINTSELIKKVEQIESQGDSAIAVMKELSDLLKGDGDAQAKIDAATAMLDNQAAELAQAIVSFKPDGGGSTGGVA